MTQIANSDSPSTVSGLFAEVHRITDHALRYVASGGSALLTFGLVEGNHFRFLCVDSPPKELSAWLLVLFISAPGIAIYAVHRALLYRTVGMIAYMIVLKTLRKKNDAGFSSKNVSDLYDLLIQRQLSRMDSKDGTKWLPKFATWAAEVHYLYCSAWGIVCAVLIAQALSVGTPISKWISAIIALVLLIAAEVHDVCMIKKELVN